MYAIIDVADKQYKVSENDTLFVPLLNEKENAKITIDKVLLIAKGDDIKVGTPTVKGAKVKATVLEHVKADKVLVFKKKRRKRFKVKRGHRQQYTKIQIESMTAGGGSTRKKADDAEEGAE